MAALIVSAIVTPDATLFTMLMMAVPLMLLYEVGILGARWFGVRRPPEDRAGSGETGLPGGTAGVRVR
jgi:sec-independent protein translocase protein TatC